MIRVHSVRYQRNGVAGIGFYALLFESEGRAFVGFVVPRYSEDGERELAPEIYGVIDPASPREAWRGDHFADEMWAACQRADADGSAHRTTPEGDAVIAGWLRECR